MGIGASGYGGRASGSIASLSLSLPINQNTTAIIFRCLFKREKESVLQQWWTMAEDKDKNDSRQR
ncbi:uncharacterized protein G2W53_005202 [Senna tora]|uniref:Uncharacterized protein n=1 Tax=Senna tora TaxID=362788 RepID=A0A834XD14_9FABA|nr:uncharacterized protein G2W53_005202 [Senna tora]